MGGHHRGRHAIAVAPALGPEGTASVTIGSPSEIDRTGTPGDRRGADPEAARPAALTVEDFNQLDVGAAAQVLSACLDVPEWAAVVAAGRPYRTAAEVYQAGAAAAALLTWPQVSSALDRHPRIGQRRAAVTGSATESAWSSAEQSGVANSDAQALAQGNADYETRFGHLFLICASGLSGEAILAALHARLGNDPAVEQNVATDELRKIALLRLAKAVAR